MNTPSRRVSARAARVAAFGQLTLALLLAKPLVAAGQSPQAAPPAAQDPLAAPQAPAPDPLAGLPPPVEDPTTAPAPAPRRDDQAGIPQGSLDPLIPDAPVPPPKGSRPIRHMDLGLSLFEAYDLTTVDSGLPGLPVDARLMQDTSFSGVDASLTYSQVGHDSILGASAGSNLRYYSIAPELLPLNYFGALTFSRTLGRRVRFRASQHANYSPFYSFGSSVLPLDANTLAAQQADQTIATLTTISSNSSAGLGWTLGRRSSLDVGGSFDYLDTSSAAYRIRSEGLNASYRHQRTKYFALRLGYGFNRTGVEFQNASYYLAHNIDAGIGYRRPLSFSRHSIVSFDLGTTMFTQGPTRSFYFTGNAALTQQLSRTWAASLAYQRGVSKIAGIATPFIADSMSGSVGGSLTRHAGFSLGGSYSRGESAIGPQNGYTALSGDARIQYTVGRYLPLYVEYVYYRSQFEQSIGLGPGFPLLVQRNGLRTGLAYSLPLVGQRPGQR